MIAFIQAGGAGTRLKSITGDVLKPMVPIEGKPILQWQIESLHRGNVNDITLVVPSTDRSVEDYFGDGSSFGVKLHYIKEDQPLGTAGALYYFAKDHHEDFLLVFGDLMLDVDWDRFYEFHKKKKAILTTFAHPNGHPYDSDVLVCQGDKVVHVLSKKEERKFFYKNLTNAGLYVVSKQLLATFKAIDEPMKMDFEKDILLPTVYSDGVYAYRSSEYVKDCGTPDRYYGVSEDCRNGIVAARNLSKPQRCIFLDRDGTINVFGDFVRKSESLYLIPGAAEAIKRINASPFLAICVTNQPVIARGETTLGELEQIHFKLEDLLGDEGAYLNDLYFCPHHPDKGFPGEVPEYKIKCNCRKPNIGMLQKAQAHYNIDLSKSWMVGDTLQDVQTGINAGCRTVLLTSGDPRPYAKYADAKPDYVAKDLAEAVDYILTQEGCINKGE